MEGNVGMNTITHMQVLQILYSCLFRQRQFKMLLSFHQYLLKRDVGRAEMGKVQGHVDVSLSSADLLMTSAVMEHKLQFASNVWKTVPETWHHSSRLYCRIPP